EDLFRYRCPSYFLTELGCLSDYDSKWPMVDKYNQPVIQVVGTVNSIKVSGEDFYAIHTSHDVEIELSLEPEYRWLSLFPRYRTPEKRAVAILSGQALSETPAVQTVIETESLGLPPNVQYPDIDVRPGLNDRVTVAGRWIFDCCHD